jgi:hypothetical protein
MNPTTHAQICVSKYGGIVEDYIRFHHFIDQSKEIECTNKHRILTHSIGFIRNVMVPIFGHRFQNSNGRAIDLKDMLEETHIAADYRGKFLPNLSDWMPAISDSPEDKPYFDSFFEENKDILTQESRMTLMYPYFATGLEKSLHLTCNFWFCSKIMPMLYPGLRLKCGAPKLSEFFDRIEYHQWMQNGNGVPARLLNK